MVRCLVGAGGRLWAFPGRGFWGRGVKSGGSPNGLFGDRPGFCRVFGLFGDRPGLAAAVAGSSADKVAAKSCLLDVAR